MKALKALVVPLLVGILAAGLLWVRQSGRPGSELVEAGQTALQAAQVDLADRQQMPDLPDLAKSWSDVQTLAKFCGVRMESEAGDRPGPDGKPVFTKGMATAWYGRLAGPALDVVACAQLANARVPIAFNSILIEGADETRAQLTFTIYGRT